ncbi:hypothetical protein TNCV_1225091 [Trichonephila clavipes]|nr:hypothetical protein TNCV_1225091 [Trichonephila clavipes]
MIVESIGQEKILSQEDYVLDGHVPLLRKKTTEFGEWLRWIVLRLQQKFELRWQHSDNCHKSVTSRTAAARRL